MEDFIAAVGLVLVFEGIAFASFPSAVKRALAEAAQAPVERMRIIGLASAIAGIGVVWYVRRVGL